MAYAEAPERIRRWVERELGSTVVAAHDQIGGFSPGPAARLVTASGRRAFVKAVGSGPNPLSPSILRQELEALRRLPSGRWRPELFAAYDDGEWIGLLLQDVEGRQPKVWTEPDVRVVFDALTELSGALSEVPWPEAARLVEREHFAGWSRIADQRPGDLPAWVPDRLPELIALEQAAPKVLNGDSLVHFDIRRDNLLITDEGTVVFLDWAWTCRGAVWADVVLTAFDLPSGLDPEALLVRHPLTATVDPDAITTVVASFAGMLTAASRQSPPPGLPTVREYQRSVAGLLVDWTGRRLER